MSLWDLQGQYTGIKNVTITLGVKNLFDTNPPQTNQQNTFQRGLRPVVLRRARALRVRSTGVRLEITTRLHATS